MHVPWVGHQVGLELVDVYVQLSIEANGGSHCRDDLADKTVEVAVRGTGHVQVVLANRIHSFVVQEIDHLGMFKQGVGGQHGAYYGTGNEENASENKPRSCSQRVRGNKQRARNL